MVGNLGEVGEHLQPWQTSAAGPYLTIRPGGPFDAVVTATAAGDGQVLVEAVWSHGTRSVSAHVPGSGPAHRLAQEWAQLLAAGQEPAPPGTS